MRVLKVVAVCADGPSSEEDEGVSGTYEVEVNNDLCDEKVASVALDLFHSAIGVSTLDDFEFFVVDPDTNNFLAEAEGHEAYSGTALGGEVEKISDAQGLPSYALLSSKP